MFVFINALKSITRSKGRNILIGIIVLAIAASSCVALAIRNAANEAENTGAGLLSITGSISIDRQKLMEAAQSGGDMNAMREMMSRYQSLSLPELLSYARSDYVKNFYYTSSIALNAAEGLEAYGAGSISGSDSFGGFGGRQGGAIMGGAGISLGALGDFTVTGYSAEDAMTKFVDGTSKITDGVMFDAASPDMNCLISNELALYNNLSAGDTITLANPNAEDETYTFTIAGIYTDSGSGETGNQMRFTTSQDPANLICVSYESLRAVIDHSASVAVTEINDFGFEFSTALNGQVSSTFVFTNRENYDRFGDELFEKGLPEVYTLTSPDINNYESALIPLKNLSDFAATLLFIVLAIGAVILIVINMFNIRERKYEVGVLTAIGIRKGKVALQFVTELLCVTLAAIIIGTGIGAAVSVPVSNTLLSEQIERIESQAVNRETNFGRAPGGGMRQDFPGGRGSMMDIFGSGRAEVNYLDKINATVNFPILGQLILIGIILTLLSSFAAVVFVMRYEPLKILANRS